MKIFSTQIRSGIGPCGEKKRFASKQPSAYKFLSMMVSSCPRSLPPCWEECPRGELQQIPAVFTEQ
jgi:hypothetical protein